VTRQERADLDAELVEFTGDHDHLHPLVDLTARVNRASTHRRFRSPSHLAASCGGAPPSIIRQHVEQHRRPDQGCG
jgi:putative transposase